MKWIAIIFALMLAGCTSAPPKVERYKFIPVEVVKTKTRTKTVTKIVPRDCPALPDLPDTASPSQTTTWAVTVVRMYKECAK